GVGALVSGGRPGRPPLAGTQPAVLAAVLNEEPVPPSRRNARVPRDLETICLKCLRKEPERRYPDAAALAEELRRYRAGEPIRARPVGRAERLLKWARRRPAALGLLTLLAAALVVAEYGRRASEQQRQRAEHASREAERLQTEAEKERDSATRERGVAESERQRAAAAEAEAQKQWRRAEGLV